MGLNLSKDPLLGAAFNAAKPIVDKHDLVDWRPAVYLVIDRSGSMTEFYRDGTVQWLAEMILAVAAHFDDDGIVPVTAFGTDVHPTVNISVERAEGSITALHESLGPMGLTNYAAAIRAVRKLHMETAGDRAGLVIFQTDGSPDSPDSEAEAKAELCAAAEDPIFWQFIGFGYDSFAFLRKLDQLAVPRHRPVDNAGFFAAGPDPKARFTGREGDLYGLLLDEFAKQWLPAYTRYAESQ